jgi:hypothetical protein
LNRYIEAAIVVDVSDGWLSSVGIGRIAGESVE